MNKWKCIPYSGNGRINIGKMAMLPKALCKFNNWAYKYTNDIFKDINLMILKYIWSYKTI